MFGKNNREMQDQKNAPKVTRYGFRKLSFGLASVALGSLLMMGPAPIAVNAAEGDVATELAAEEGYTLSFVMEDGSILQSTDYGTTMNFDDLRALGEDLAKARKDESGEFRFEQVGNDLRFIFAGLQETPEEAPVDLNHNISFRVKDEDGNYNEFTNFVYENLTVDEMQELAIQLADYQVQFNGQYSYSRVDNDWVFYFEGLEETPAPEVPVSDEYLLTFYAKDENGEFEQIFQNGYEGYTQEEFLEMAILRADQAAEFNGQYSYTAVDNDYKFYFEGLEETPEVPVSDEFLLTFYAKDENGEFEQIFQNGYEGYTQEEFLEMAILRADQAAEFNGQYSYTAVDNDYKFYFEGLEEVAPEVWDHTISFRVKDEDGNYNEFMNFVYEDLTVEEMEELVLQLADYQVQFNGQYSYTRVDNDWVFYFEGLEEVAPEVMDHNLSFRVKDEDGNYNEFMNFMYEDLTVEEMQELALQLADFQQQFHGQYSYSRVDGDWIFYFEGLETEVPVGEEHTISFRVKDEDGTFNEFMSFVYEGLTVEEMQEIVLQLADFQVQFHGQYSYTRVDNDWVFYFEGLKDSIPMIPLEPSIPVKPSIPMIPLEPSIPVKPSVPMIPLEPSIPVKPSVPMTPLVPSTPIVDEVPMTPLVPSTPIVDEVPMTPLVPSTPVKPGVTTPDTEKPSDSTDKGEKLPVTSTGVFSLGVAGLVSVLGGAGVEALRRKKK